jgi:hypothetical protein
MNSDSYASVAIAVLCVVALGVSATTLESSLSTDPDDVIDLDWEKLPISQEDAADVQSEMQSDQGSSDGDGGDGGTSDSESGETTETEKTVQEQQQEREEQQQDQQSDPQEQDPDGDSFLPGQTTIWDILLDLLPWLVALAWLAAVCGTLYRYREQALALSLAVLPRGSEDGEGDAGEDWAVDPANEVDQLWLAMVRRLDVDDPETTTPTEFAREAVRAGMDPDGVRTLTGVFEEVRYGDTGVTEDRERRAQDAFRKLGLDDDRSPENRGRESRADGGESR